MKLESLTYIFYNHEILTLLPLLSINISSSCVISYDFNNVLALLGLDWECSASLLLIQLISLPYKNTSFA